MKIISLVMVAVLAGAPVAVAQESGSAETERQVPVEEGVDLPDAPAADEAQGNAEAQEPAVDQDDSSDSSDAEEPPVEGAPAPEQPGVEP
jgi:hypothetical protein